MTEMPETKSTETYEAVVIGAGPNGFGNLILAADQYPGALEIFLQSGICWVDPSPRVGTGFLGNMAFREGEMNTPRSHLLEVISHRSAIYQRIAQTPFYEEIADANKQNEPINFGTLAKFLQAVSMVGMNAISQVEKSRILNQAAVQITRSRDLYQVTLANGSLIQARNLVMANGAESRNLKFGDDELDKKIVDSSEILTSEGLEQIKRAIMQGGSRKIIIFGSGQSALLTARYLAKEIGPTMLDEIIIAHKQPFLIYSDDSSKQASNAATQSSQTCSLTGLTNCTRGLRGEERKVIELAKEGLPDIPHTSDNFSLVKVGKVGDLKLKLVNFDINSSQPFIVSYNFAGVQKIAFSLYNELKSASVIIAANGYQAPDLSIYGEENEIIGPLRSKEGRFIVTSNAGQLYDMSVRPMQNAYGLGLAYGGRKAIGQGGGITLLGPDQGELAAPIAIPSLRRHFQVCRGIVDSILASGRRNMSTTELKWV